MNWYKYTATTEQIHDIIAASNSLSVTKSCAVWWSGGLLLPVLVM